MALATDGSPFEGLLLTDSVPFQICTNHFLILTSDRIVQVGVLDSAENSLWSVDSVGAKLVS